MNWESATRTALIGTLVVGVAVVVVLLPVEFLLEPKIISGNLPAVAGVVTGFTLSIFGKSILSELRD
jgi:Na+/proline symporter